MAMISMPGFSELWIVILFFGYWALVLTTVIRIMQRTDLEMAVGLLWTILILFTPIIGIVLYNIFGVQRKPA